MSNKVEYSRFRFKRSTVPGVEPTAPTATTIDNTWLDTDLLVGEGFINVADDKFWFRTENGIVEVAMSGVSSNNYYTELAYLSGNTIVFDRNDSADAYSVDLSSILNSGDLFVSGSTGVYSIQANNGTAYAGGNYALVGGTSSGTSEFDLVFGRLNYVSGSTTFAHGDSHTSGAQYGALFGGEHSTLGNYTFAQGFNHEIQGTTNHSAILGGSANVVLTNVDRSVILGGTGISATTDDTVYVPALNIRDIGGGTPIINLGVDSSGNVVTGTTGGGAGIYLALSGGTMTGDITMTDGIRMKASNGSSITMNDSSDYLNLSGNSAGVIIQTGDLNNAIVVQDTVTINGGLYLSSIGGTTPIINLGLDAGGNVVTGTTGGGSGTAVWTAGTGTSSIKSVDGGNTSSSTGSLAGGTSSTASGTYAFAYGNTAAASANYAFAHGQFQTQSGAWGASFGYGHITSNSYSFSVGQTTRNYGSHSVSAGGTHFISGNYAYCFGTGTRTAGGTQYNFMGGHSTTENFNSSGNYNFGWQYHTSTSQDGFASSYGAILAGGQNKIESSSNYSAIIVGSGCTVTSAERAVIIGLQGYTATQSDTVYVPGLNIQDVGSGTPIINLGIDSNGFVVTGTTGGGGAGVYLPLSGGTMTGDLKALNLSATTISILNSGATLYSYTDYSSNTIQSGVTDSTIAAGSGNTINSGLSNVLVAGVNLTATQNDTAYFSNINTQILSATTLNATTLNTTTLSATTYQGAPYDLMFALSDETSQIVTGNTIFSMIAPRAMTTSKVKVSISQSATTTTEIDIYEDGVTILPTTISIASGETWSYVDVTTGIADSSEITVDILQAGTGAVGLKAYIIGKTN